MRSQAPLAMTVIHLVLDNGERLPCLVNRHTWLPMRLATRWAVRYRRYRVRASTLVGNLRVIGKIYSWAATVAGLDLDTFLTSGEILDARQLESLAVYLRQGNSHRAGIVSASTYNQQLGVVENFITWTLYPANRGGATTLTFEQLSSARDRCKFLFRSLRMRGGASLRHQPLTDAAVEAIRTVIAPERGANGAWYFGVGGFSASTALRNWLMFEMALELGLRRGELLKLRLDSLPRGAEEGLKVLRYPDDPYDSRGVEPGVKTAERLLPVSRPLLRALRAYLTLPPPQGRVAGRSPYLFVTRRGDPLAIDTARDVIRDIGRRAGVARLSWHRLRHTWAERMAVVLLAQPNGLDRLMYLGGWTHPESPKRYIQRALEEQAGQSLRDYHEQLYRAFPEGGRDDS